MFAGPLDPPLMRLVSLRQSEWCSNGGRPPPPVTPVFDKMKACRPRGGSRIQKGGGGSYIQKGGGGFVQEFQERIQIVAGSWANQQAKKKLQTAVGGGGPITPKKTPVSAHETLPISRRTLLGLASPPPGEKSCTRAPDTA